MNDAFVEAVVLVLPSGEAYWFDSNVHSQDVVNAFAKEWTKRNQAYNDGLSSLSVAAITMPREQFVKVSLARKLGIGGSNLILPENLLHRVN